MEKLIINVENHAGWLIRQERKGTERNLSRVSLASEED